MYLEGKYVESTQQFNKVLWGPTTTYYITRAKEMSDGRWAEVFRCLNSVLARKRQAEYANHSGPPPSDTHLPVPDSDSDRDFPGPGGGDNGGGGIPYSQHELPLTDHNFSIGTQLYLLGRIWQIQLPAP